MFFRFLKIRTEILKFNFSLNFFTNFRLNRNKSSIYRQKYICSTHFRTKIKNKKSIQRKHDVVALVAANIHPTN